MENGTKTKRILDRAERLLKSCIKQGYGQENAARIAFEISERFEAEAYARIKAAEALKK